ncbi:hypothetical protein [Actinomadura harenae]|uniref:DUF2304 family protein n=1 Tax=Actinomadura harenae TaxID=2483351 RepID=A0A3M2M5H8_9ACTN|nr:hypothetical protein [Actinomadura harenae]RMI44073.1 hypothetical protein EBO15_14230 [Actinomadura harenae]
MTITVPLVVLVGVAVWVAWRYIGLRVWHLVLCLVFGFLLASSAAAPSIDRLLTGLVRMVTTKH